MSAQSDSVVKRAKKLAISLHDGQQYGPVDNPLPYRWHIEHVAELASRMGYPDEVVAAGWLHDVVEDTEITLEQLADEHGFNQLIIDAVSAVTFIEGDDTDKIAKAKSDRLGHVVKFCDAAVNFSVSAIFGPKPTHEQKEILTHRYLPYLTELEQNLPTVREITDKVRKWHEKND